LLPHLPVVGDVDIVRKQLPIVVTFYEKPMPDSAIKKYHEHYRDYAADLTRVLKPSSNAA
jgi:hypothetical protein|tara:strand:- start:1002 stop:1181 length:180 start_codon:yes stop_codon:yes gene_type:complete